MTCLLGRAFAWVWRFKELQLGRRLFLHSGSSMVLGRPFFGFTLDLDVPRSTTHWLLYLQGERAVNERGIVTKLMKPGDRVVDVGANIGYYLLMIKRVVGDAGVVFCFEPEPANLVELKQNIARNHLANVHVFEAAVDMEARHVRFARGLNGRVVEGDEGDITIETVTLDSLVQDAVDFVKIDVEGYEGQVLHGAAGLIARCRPTLVVEVHPSLLTGPYSVADIVRFLRSRYEEVVFYECRQRTDLIGVALMRYGLMAQVAPIPEEQQLIDDCAHNRRSETFWAVACASPSRQG